MSSPAILLAPIPLEVDPATAILLHNMTPSGFSLSNFIDAATHGAWEASFTSGNTFDGLAEEVAKGSKVVALVNIAQAQYGLVVAEPDHTRR